MEPIIFTEREIDILEGMIEYYVVHTEISKYQKQKDWDMERANILKKCKNYIVNREKI